MMLLLVGAPELKNHTTTSKYCTVLYCARESRLSDGFKKAIHLEFRNSWMLDLNTIDGTVYEAVD